VYGGVLLAPWFDRDLSLAGRAHCLMGNQQVKPLLVNVNRPIGVIPSLAIHLNPGVNQNHKINPQTELVPIVGQLKDGNKSPVLKEMVKQHLLDQGHQVQQVLAYELSLYDNQPPAIVGLQDEFIASARLDNLLSCFVALQSLLNTRSQRPCMLVCNDHEEVGSRSASGASGPFLTSVLKRLWGDQYQEQSYQRMLQHSWLISMDNAHGIHPNYPGKHDGNHSPVLNQGPVIKINANQSYASNSGGCAKLVQLAEQQGIPLQYFVSRADMACGSTIGPLTASNSGIETLDVGVATFAMHSIRELAGSADPYYLYQLARAFYDQ
jgi:aspartyl aminopeptidase